MRLFFRNFVLLIVCVTVRNCRCCTPALLDSAYVDACSTSLYMLIMCLCVTEGDDAHPVTVELAEREVEEEQSAGLPWDDLVTLFGQTVQSLGLETAAADGDNDSPLAMKWTEDNIRK